MKLSDTLVNLGHPVVYYPGLNKLTKSTNASLLLGQLIYWQSKNPPGGWVKKTQPQLTVELGLSRAEQNSARKALVDSGILEEEFFRIKRTNAYRVNLDKLNTLWEECGKNPIPHAAIEIIVEAQEIEETPTAIMEEISEIQDDYGDFLKVKKPSMKSKVMQETVAKSTNIVQKSVPQQTAKNPELEIVKIKLENGLHIIADDYKWKEFIEFVVMRQEKYNEQVDTYISWAIREGFNPIYWTPAKMKTTYPQAFVVKKTVQKPAPNQETNLVDVREKDYVPMPDSLKVKRNLF